MATELNVQYSDETEMEIVAVFGSSQDPGIYPNQGVVSTTDARWHQYFDSIPSAAQRALPTPS